MAKGIRVTIQLLKVLDAMLEAPDEDHWGFELIKLTGLASGTLYPLLARLEEAGWLVSGWEVEPEPGRPRRRYYRLTGAGVTAAVREINNLPGRRRVKSMREGWQTAPRPSYGGGL